ncbi:MAG: hypothetical protein D6681_06745, partial [Calditrichaeota bacterium]
MQSGWQQKRGNGETVKRGSGEGGAGEAEKRRKGEKEGIGEIEKGRRGKEKTGKLPMGTRIKSYKEL